LSVQLKRIILFYLLVLCLFLPVTGGDAQPAAEPDGVKSIYLLKLQGMITAGQAAFIQRQLDILDPQAVQAVIIHMDTPGGLVDATLVLSKVFAAAPVPVVVFVGPSGAIAASAGAFILVSADIAAMAPGTTVGAAKPVALSPGGAEPADDKTINFLAGHMRSISEERGRPGEITERFVTENLTLSATEALEQDVIELLVPNVDALLVALHGWEGEKGGRAFTLITAGAPLLEQEMTLRERFQDKISNPQIAFLLLMAGALGIYFGLGMPGTFVPEVMGALALLLGIYGIGLFDTNTMGIIFLIVGFALLITEIFTSGFGVLGIGGAVSLLIGAVLLPREPLMAEGWYPTFLATAVGLVLAVSLISLVITTVLLRSRRSWAKSGAFFRAASVAEVVELLAPCGTVRMRGELWKACSEDGSTLKEGARVAVVRQDGLTLFVRPIDGDRQAGDMQGKESDSAG
jgi:membrane-bound serine protease (ClpP class)